ncbi:MAG: hypothetical protein EA363_06330 [Balneolaceae bacterium]|nr:MAG: hypothetical protein EA363_06330 [Balneolaceae bacterium]
MTTYRQHGQPENAPKEQHPVNADPSPNPESPNLESLDPESTNLESPNPESDKRKSRKQKSLNPEKAGIALLTDHRYTAARADKDDWYLANILRDDALLQVALSDLGISSVRVDWADAGIDWSAFSCAVFRTTWDYFERIPEFLSWLGNIENDTLLCNEAALIRWNLDKHYLADLEQQDIPIVPTRFLEPGSEATLSDVINETGWHDAILKPCISGAARHTYRINRTNAGRIHSELQPLLNTESFIIQPFLADILHSGEDTLILIDGEYTHAVTKKPKPGDFRVQDDHGGTVHHCRPTREQIELAERTIAACRTVTQPATRTVNRPATRTVNQPSTGAATRTVTQPATGAATRTATGTTVSRSGPVYGRVDMVRDSHGDWRVMELELIEPELWLRNHPPAARALAHAIARFLKS